jgi:YfiH family protein
VGVLVADCCCLLMADVHGLAVAAVHAGWRGSLDGIACRAVRMLQRERGIAPRDLRVWISPAISGKNYTVSQELWERFHRDWGDGPGFLLQEPYRIDLPKLNACQLLKCGVPVEGIEDAGLCTLISETCFSHRRGDSPQGRMLGMIALPPSGVRRKPLLES